MSAGLRRLLQRYAPGYPPLIRDFFSDGKPLQLVLDFD